MGDTVQPGKWYLTVTCHHCHQGIALMEDPNRGEELPLEFLRDQERVTCPFCQQVDDYPVSEFQKMQGLPRGSLN